MTRLPTPPRRALAVMAHPDDVEFMAGGLVSRWARADTELHYLLRRVGGGWIFVHRLLLEYFAEPDDEARGR
jgi:hypothetical protein